MFKSIDVLLSRPGIYFVLSLSKVCFIEVEDGRCYQLEIASGRYERDGELRPGGWILGEIEAIHGPFARFTTSSYSESGPLSDELQVQVTYREERHG